MADDTFAKRYDVGEQVGAGGMGRVHRATDRETGAAIALKVLRDPGVDERFTLEAEMLERMDHPAIVAYVGHGVTRSGEAYLAMAWLDGESLADRLRRGMLPVLDLVAIGARVAGAIAHAHAHAIVHRDIKPSNVVLVDGEPERATLIDFGIAKDTAVTHGLTRSGQLVGTPGYMAPEQATGAGTAASAMDVFALGALLYECATGRPPFVGAQMMEVLAQVLLKDPPAPRTLRPELPIRLEALILALLEKEPERRTVQASQVEAELRTIARAITQHDDGLLAEPPTWAPRPRVTESAPTVREPRRSRVRLVAAIGAVVAGVIVTMFVLQGGQSRSTTETTAEHACRAEGGDACARACDANDAVACRVYGRSTFTTARGDADGQRAAIASLAKGCTLGDASACTLAGQFARKRALGGDAAYPRETWLGHFERGCALDAGASCALLAAILVPDDRARAIEIYERNCTVNPTGCARAADLLERGDAAERARAAKLRADACARGFRKACR
jgi:hypothetical protein